MNLSTIMELALDPTVLYLAAAFLAPAFGGFPRPLSAAETLACFTHPIHLRGGALVLAAFLAVKRGGPTVRLPLADRARARWYLLNGVHIHLILDVLVGTYHYLPPFAATYCFFDSRYCDVAASDYATALHTVSLLEVLVMFPLCVALYGMYHRGSAARDVTEVVVCCFQFIGTVFYFVPELLRKDTLGSFIADWGLEFTLKHLVCFWFLLFATFLYFVIPVALGVHAALRIVRQQRRLRELLDRNAQPVLSVAVSRAPNGRPCSTR
jgi:hypothetical protein